MADDLFDFAERAQTVRSEMTNPEKGAPIQMAIEKLKLHHHAQSDSAARRHFRVGEVASTQMVRILIETPAGGYDKTRVYKSPIEEIRAHGWKATGDRVHFSGLRTIDGKRVENDSFDHWNADGLRFVGQRRRILSR